MYHHLSLKGIDGARIVPYSQLDIVNSILGEVVIEYANPIPCGIAPSIIEVPAELQISVIARSRRIELDFAFSNIMKVEESSRRRIDDRDFQ